MNQDCKKGREMFSGRRRKAVVEETTGERGREGRKMEGVVCGGMGRRQQNEGRKERRVCCDRREGKG